MKIKRQSVFAVTLMIVVLVAASTRLRADTGTCGGATTTLPFTDVGSSFAFCFIAEIFFQGITVGTSPTTYSPGGNVTREQMAAFLSRTLDAGLKKGSRRAALKQWWTPTSADGIELTTVVGNPQLVESDGADLWVANINSGTVSRVRASDGKLLETWTGATLAFGVLAAKGRIFVTGQTFSGSLYQIDPRGAPGPVTTLTSSLGGTSLGIAFDGARVWTGNHAGSVSIVTLNPVSVTTATTGFSSPVGMLYDGANIWVTDEGDNTLRKLDANGNILLTVSVGTLPQFPVFDGTNIWVPNPLSQTVTVVRAATGAVLATLSGNGLNNPITAAFDGERILVTNRNGGSVSLWKAADLTPLGSVSTGASTLPNGACSDGLNFWITLTGTDKLARF